MSTAVEFHSNATFWECQELKFFFLWHPPSNFFPHNLDGAKEVDNGATPFVAFLFAAVVLLRHRGHLRGSTFFHLVIRFLWSILVVSRIDLG